MGKGVDFYNTRVDELYHWGIPGMKWGRRRYQNEDGTLTEEGKIRYSKYSELNKDQRKDSDKLAKATSELYRTGGDTSSAIGSIIRRYGKADPRKSPAKKMSDDELRQNVNRLNMERQYNQLTGYETKPGAEFIAGLFDSGADLLKVAGAISLIRMGMRKIR